MKIEIYGPFARKRKSWFSLGLDIRPGMVVVGLFFWNIYFGKKEE